MKTSEANIRVLSIKELKPNIEVSMMFGVGCPTITGVYEVEVEISVQLKDATYAVDLKSTYEMCFESFPTEEQVIEVIKKTSKVIAG